MARACDSVSRHQIEIAHFGNKSKSRISATNRNRAFRRQIVFRQQIEIVRQCTSGPRLSKTEGGAAAGGWRGPATGPSRAVPAGNRFRRRFVRETNGFVPRRKRETVSAAAAQAAGPPAQDQLFAQLVSSCGKRTGGVCRSIALLSSRHTLSSSRVKGRALRWRARTYHIPRSHPAQGCVCRETGVVRRVIIEPRQGPRLAMEGAHGCRGVGGCDASHRKNVLKIGEMWKRFGSGSV